MLNQSYYITIYKEIKFNKINFIKKQHFTNNFYKQFLQTIFTNNFFYTH